MEPTVLGSLRMCTVPITCSCRASCGSAHSVEDSCLCTESLPASFRLRAPVGRTRVVRLTRRKLWSTMRCRRVVAKQPVKEFRPRVKVRAKKTSKIVNMVGLETWVLLSYCFLVVHLQIYSESLGSFGQHSFSASKK